jgi:NDP-sugar pyrophosphorylase family protein
MIANYINGNVVLSTTTVIHPRVKIVAEEGKNTIIGDGNVIEEICVVVNSIIGNNNLIEVCTSIDNVDYFI